MATLNQIVAQTMHQVPSNPIHLLKSIWDGIFQQIEASNNPDLLETEKKRWSKDAFSFWKIHQFRNQSLPLS